MPRKVQKRRCISLRPDKYDQLALLSHLTKKSMSSIVEKLINDALDENQLNAGGGRDEGRQTVLPLSGGHNRGGRDSRPVDLLSLDYDEDGPP